MLINDMALKNYGNMRTWPVKVLISCLYIKSLVINSVLCDWSYVNATIWGKTWKDCAKTHQSPVNIIDAEAATLVKDVTFNFNENIGKPLEVTLTNNGRTAKLVLPPGSNVSVTGNRLYIKNRYRLLEVHFHWGESMNTGSEHMIDGHRSSMEVHLVHYNIKYTSFKIAEEKLDGVLVLSVLVDVSTNVSQNSFWKEISDILSVVQNPGSKRKLGNVKFSDFLPGNKDDFYLYKGSFTTPPCFETVTWVLFKERLLIPSEYVERFRALRTNASGSQVRLASNIRPVQPLNTRTILKTFKSAGSKDFENHVSEKVVQGKEVVGVVRFYQCRIPTSVSLAIIIPASDITWISQNLTSDISTLLKPVSFDATKRHGVALEMHYHPKGRHKDQVHVNVTVDGSELINNFYELNKECLQDSCTWSTVGKSRTCTRRLVDTDEKLLFTMTRLNKCDDAYEVTIKKDNDVVFETIAKPRSTRVKVTLHTVDANLSNTLGRGYLVLYVKTENFTSHAKLFLDIPHQILNNHKFLMEGLYHNGPNCNSPSGTPDHVKLIVGISVGIFILAVIVLTVCLYLMFEDASSPSMTFFFRQEQETRKDPQTFHNAVAIKE